MVNGSSVECSTVQWYVLALWQERHHAKKKTGSNCSLLKSTALMPFSVKAKMSVPSPSKQNWNEPREITYVKLCKIVRLMFQQCHLRLHRDWTRGRERERSIPRVLENVRVRIHWKLLFPHYHPSCLMFPLVWGGGGWGETQTEECHGRKCGALAEQTEPKDKTK